MRNDFAVLILSHGRADRVYTIPTLRKGGYTGKIYTHTDGDLYICNHSLYKTVEAYTDPGRIAVLNLTPTSAFYLSIREIPYGSNIFIFNNKRKYCETLEHLCRSCGLNDYYYTPLPYPITEDLGFHLLTDFFSQAPASPPLTSRCHDFLYRWFIGQLSSKGGASG